MSALLAVDGLRFFDRGPFTFSLRAGECLGLQGESGIGKSQLLRAIVDLIPHTGQVYCEGRAASEQPAPQWRTKLTMIPAEIFWWHDRVGEHFQTPADEDDFLASQLQILGLPREVLNWQVSRLSTGERQRIGLLRGMQNKPRVILLDEPTSALDETNTRRVEDLLLDYMVTFRAGLVWVSHDPLQIERVAERTLLMGKNKLTEANSGRQSRGKRT